ncbi:hypothetical protein D3C78_986590 [compost metagenome]
MLQLTLHVQWIGLYDNSARQQYPVIGNNRLRTVRQHDGDTIPLRKAKREQPGSQPNRIGMQLAVGHRFAQKMQRIMIRITINGI